MTTIKKPRKTGSGRPSSYDPAFCEEILGLMAKGTSKEAAIGRLGFSRRTLYNWTEKHPEFKAAVELGEVLSLDFFEKKLIQMIDLPPSAKNTTALIFAMKRRFGFAYGEDELSKQDEVVPGFNIALDENA